MSEMNSRQKFEAAIAVSGVCVGDMIEFVKFHDDDELLQTKYGEEIKKFVDMIVKGSTGLMLTMIMVKMDSKRKKEESEASEEKTEGDLKVKEYEERLIEKISSMKGKEESE